MPSLTLSGSRHKMSPVEHIPQQFFGFPTQVEFPTQMAHNELSGSRHVSGTQLVSGSRHQLPHRAVSGAQHKTVLTCSSFHKVIPSYGRFRNVLSQIGYGCQSHMKRETAAVECFVCLIWEGLVPDQHSCFKICRHRLPLVNSHQ